MPVTLEPPSAVVHAAWNPRERRRRRAIRDPGRRILVGLVNNMPDAALAATERQFARLLEDAGADYDVRLRLYALESMPRSLEARRAMQATYHRARSLCVTRLDALIVTGAEPRAPSLPEEIYWRELVSIFDLARANAIDAILVPGRARRSAALGRNLADSAGAQTVRGL